MKEEEKILTRYEFLKQQDMPGLIKRLEAFIRINTCFHVVRLHSSMKEPVDWIMEAIERFVNGTRVYDPRACSFFSYMCGSIRSSLSNELKKFEQLSGAQMSIDEVDSNVPQLVQGDPTQKIADDRDIRSLLEKLKAQDAWAHNVVAAILFRGLDTDKEIADYFKTTKYKVQRGKLAAKEILMKLIKSDDGGTDPNWNRNRKKSDSDEI